MHPVARAPLSVRLELLGKQDPIVGETSAARFAVSIASHPRPATYTCVGLGQVTALCEMGCSSSALNKAGDSSSRFGSGGEQGTYTAPTQGDSAFWLPPDPEVRSWPSLAIRGRAPSRGRREHLGGYPRLPRAASSVGTEVCPSLCAHRVFRLRTAEPRAECCLAWWERGFLVLNY